LLVNVTQDTVIRFLTPFLLEEKHVDAAIRLLRKLLADTQKQRKTTKSAEAQIAVAQS
jgi:acetylornithine/succinyldiaminopimelate/putrescine aminotransferase